MASASTQILAENSSNVGRLTFRFTLHNPDGSAVAGEECEVTLEGDGSLAPRHDSKRILRTTNAEGSAEVVWYRRGIWGRDAHATLSVGSSVDDAAISIEEIISAVVQLRWAFIFR